MCLCSAVSLKPPEVSVGVGFVGKHAGLFAYRVVAVWFLSVRFKADTRSSLRRMGKLLERVRKSVHSFCLGWDSAG